MRKTVLLILGATSVIVLIIRLVVNPLTEVLGYQEKAGIKITTASQAAVSINGNQIGETPYQDEGLKPGEYKVKLTAGRASWEGWVRLVRGSLTVVNRELSDNIASASGEILTLNSGKGLLVTSTPNSAEVSIDGKVVGQTPLSISALSPGEHNFLLSHSGFLKRSIKAYLPDGFLLNLAVDLAVSEVDLTDQNLPPNTPQTPEVYVKSNPYGYLRVRDKPSLSANEVTRASLGEKLTLIEELSGWYKVKLKNGQEGYVSSAYVSKP